MDLPKVEWEPDEDRGGWSADIGVVRMYVGTEEADFQEYIDVWEVEYLDDCHKGWFAPNEHSLSQLKCIAMTHALELLKQGIATIVRSDLLPEVPK